MEIQFETVDDAYKHLIKKIYNEPDFITKPRGMEIREIVAPKIIITNPKNCLVTIPERKLSYSFAVAEKFEYLYGKHDPERLIAYNRQFASYQNDYGRFDGNYAERINGALDHIYGLLKKDPDSRQAVIPIYGKQDLHVSKDIPCTVLLHFMIRGGKLNLIVYMRSNDMLWGFPYDVNGFCFLQEVMALWLGIPLGTYTHIAGSLHIYTDNPERLQQLIDTSTSEGSTQEWNPVWDLNYEETKLYLPLFTFAEHALRTHPEGEEWKYARDLLPKVLQDYLLVLRRKWVK